MSILNIRKINGTTIKLPDNTSVTLVGNIKSKNVSLIKVNGESMMPWEAFRRLGKSNARKVRKWLASIGLHNIAALKAA
jgi:hypothetical protein